MKDVIYQEVKTANDKVKVGILVYTGTGDPIKNLREAVRQYVGNEGYNEFIDALLEVAYVILIPIHTAGELNLYHIDQRNLSKSLNKMSEYYLL